MTDETKDVVVEEPVVDEAPVAEPIIDPITAKDEEIAMLMEERDNYKEVALKRLGKLPGDSALFGENDKDISSIIEEKVKMALIDKEIARKELEKEVELKRILKENSELRLAIKNRPGEGIGSGEGSGGLDVKDNVFSKDQIEDLKARAKRLGADPDKFIENAKKNLNSHK